MPESKATASTVNVGSPVTPDAGPPVPTAPPAASAPDTPADVPGPGARLDVGSHVAGYRIEALIGMGGMARVFRALDERLGRQVALKILAPELAADEAFRQRFIRESRAAAAVDHPNIIPVFEAGDFDGVLFIAMRYVQGGDVRSLVEREGPLPPEQALALVTPVASALDAAHATGLVHRDVKPANMLLDSRSNTAFHVYLTDFGVTTGLSDREANTATGEIIGTPNYMAPEQLEGRLVDGRTDQYGLACAAFEMLTGSPPFGELQGVAVMVAHMQKAPPKLTWQRPELPPGVDDVFARALAKSRTNRFTTCGQFAETLAEALGRGRASRGGATAPTRMLNIQLKPSFRYVHEPSRAGEDALASLGNDGLIAELESRIQHSRGGTFLITGFRGVGKSTLVLRALDDIAARSTTSQIVLTVVLSVARATTTEKLLFAIVRRVFETLSDSGALERLPPQTRHALLVAYMRTSLAFKETQSEARERSAGLDLSVGPGRMVKAVADFAVPKVSMSAKRSHSLATEAAFLAYSETDVEYDLMRIVSLVDRKPEAARRQSWRQRMRRWRPAPDVPRLHLIIVLDEVDKLTTDEPGLAAVEKLLSGIKNVLTMPGAHFLIVAGPDLHDRAVRDAARGNGVYESVFGWRLYVPCIWDAPERLLDDIVSRDATVSADVIDTLANYLRFKARGMPRRLLQEVNGFVVWDGDRPRLRIGAKNMERVEFYARLERILQSYVEGRGRRRLFPVPIDEDRWRIGGYYIVDWVLQSEGEPFTAADLLGAGEDGEFDPMLRVSRRNVESMLNHLAEHRVLDVVRQMSATATVYGDIAKSNEKVFCLTEEIRQLLYGFAARNESERAAHEVSLAPRPAQYGPVPTEIKAAAPSVSGYPPEQAFAGWPAAADSSYPGAAAAPAAFPPAASAAAAGAPAPAATAAPPHRPGATSEALPSVQVIPPARVIGGKYELGDLISQGGLSSLYKARDLVTGRQVVVKMLRSALGDDAEVIARFRREADIARALNHPQIARTFDVLDGPNIRALIMEWLNGPTLESLIREDGPMAPAEVAAIGRVLASALAYIGGEKIARLDMKPSNIIMAPDRGPVIVDLGIALRVDTHTTSLTGAGLFVGTPAYVAPEVIEGYEPDQRADIYALGLVLYYCIVGKNPWEELPSPMAVMAAVVSEQIELGSLPISAEFRAALAKALARNRDQRFPDASGLRDALSLTPEWRSVSDDGAGRRTSSG
jgi:serine/threonine-protein kinase